MEHQDQKRTKMSPRVEWTGAPAEGEAATPVEQLFLDLEEAGRPNAGSPATRPAVTRTGLEPLLLDVDEAAAILGVGRTFVYELLKGEHPELPHCKLGTRTKIPLTACRAYVQRKLDAKVAADGALAAHVAARLRRHPTATPRRAGETSRAGCRAAPSLDHRRGHGRQSS